jgi:hypothetical protein
MSTAHKKGEGKVFNLLHQEVKHRLHKNMSCAFWSSQLEPTQTASIKVLAP